MAVSSISGAFDSSVEGQDIIVVDPVGGERSYDLYQIFNGSLSDKNALINIDWGDSIDYKNGDTYVYQLSTTLVEALKKSTLPDGETNPIADDFKNLKADETTGIYSASAVAGIISEYTSSEQIDAFASAVGDVIENYLESENHAEIQMRTQSTSSMGGLDGSKEYIFTGVESGYYMVSESSDLVNGLTYSKYMVNIGTGSDGTKITAKATAGPDLDKYIVYGKDDPDTATVDESLHEYQAVAVADTVTFQLSSKVPDMDGYNRYYFIINDTLSKGLEYNDGSMKITVGDETLALTSDTTNTGKTFEVETVKNDDGTTSLTIIFKNFLQYKSLKGKDIKITYTADVDEDVVIGETNKNNNTADLTYSNNPNYNYQGTPGTTPDNPGNPDKPTPDEPTNTTVKDTVYVYTTGVDIVKVDANGKRLSGAKFKLTNTTENTFKVLRVIPQFEAVCYEEQKDSVFEDGETAYYCTKSNAYTTDQYTSGTISRYKTSNLTYSLVDGEYQLDINGTYYKTTGDSPEYVEKSKASSDGPYEQGYVLYKLSETSELVTATAEDVANLGLSTDANTDNEVVAEVVVATEKATEDVVSATEQSVVGTVSNQNGVISFNGLNAGTYTLTEEEAPDGYVKLEEPIVFTIDFVNPTSAKDWVCDWTYTVENNGNSGNLVEGYDLSNGAFEIQVQNLTTHTLPSTGGIGTTLFYAVGSVLVIGAVVLLITKKRMHNEEE
jgi:fimbrial isopeptide formation D2 family protein/LPXTG-motif cell wall-anchored protein